MANTTSVITTKSITVIVSVSIRATATRPMRVETSNQTAPGSRMFILKSSGNFLMGSGVCKLGVNQSNGIILLLVDDFRVYLCGFHVRVPE